MSTYKSDIPLRISSMKLTIKTLKLAPLLVSVLGLANCAKTDPHPKKQPAAPATESQEDAGYKDVAENEFINSQSDGRSVAMATWSNVYDTIDFTKVRAKTVQYYGIPNNTSFTFLNPLADRKILWTFTNFQDSVAVKDVIAGIKNACKKEGYTSHLACVDDAIYKSGSVVFEMKVKNGLPTDPNHDGHIKDALYGLLGATFINVPDHNGVTEERMTVACVSCHSTKQTKVGQNALSQLFINLQGDNSNGDILSKANYKDRFEQMKGYINDPADPIWGISEESKAGGYLAAQYLILKDRHGHTYNLDENRLTTERQKPNMKSAVDAGWVSAFANWITAARKMCNMAEIGSCDSDPLNETVMAKNTEKTTASILLNERSSILLPWSKEAPLRSQRPTYFVPNSASSSSQDFSSSVNFALNYVNYVSGSETKSPMKTALPYLLSATSISMVMPDVQDDALAKRWYGSTATVASADALVKKYLPRTIIKNYGVDALAYHTARYRYPEFMPGNFLQNFTTTEMTEADTLLKGSCANCHTSAIVKLDLLNTQIQACRDKITCNIYGRSPSALEPVIPYTMVTPTSKWAQEVLIKLETLPASNNSVEYTYMSLNYNIQSSPTRIPLMRRSALGLWSFLDYEQAIRPKAQRHAAAYALLSPKINLNRSVEPVKVALTFDFDKNGVIGQEKMFCLQTDSFDLNKDGIAETGCFDAIQILSGGTPRPVGQADSLDKIHDLIYTAQADVTNRARLAKLIAAYADGGLNLTWENGTKTQINFFPESPSLLSETTTPTSTTTTTTTTTTPTTYGY